ncbi:Membrane protein involved in the export of O-antigen and teichoic acid [Hydrobacter penzbergensis]|uniref:Membrane protein involved in the export of O-antigen and teichoic acid n=2 Tax=Hydrobacter penzbergensis TaxID=1235997 RepID=A0A8X8IAR9_9BACT|nr:Membrane protein involved in the export of O-antigen and teichoic acid [Hydrobacter penzbergensis]
MILYYFKKITSLWQSSLMRNSFWGLASNISQALLISLFYVMLARKYSATDFSYFLIAISIYQFLTTISNLGLGQWFTREVANTGNTEKIISKFLKLQLYCGAGFYLFNVLIAFALYDNHEIRLLAALAGINIVFDNLIYVIKCLNIAGAAQHITFKIVVADSILKFLMVLLFCFFPMSIIALSFGLICIRFLTLNLFLKFGLRQRLDTRSLLINKIPIKEVARIVINNWPFLVIGSASVVYWRIGNIIISKMLSLFDVAIYEISFRIFSFFQIVPLILSATLFPHFVSLYNAGNTSQFTACYKKYLHFFLIYGLFIYTFIYSFSGWMVPFLFGQQYAAAPIYTEQMFLTMLLFPTGMLQATVLISMKLEKVDMIINIISLIIVVSSILVGLSFIHSLTVVNISIFISFLIFHICQDYILVKKGILTIRGVMNFYSATVLFIAGYAYLTSKYMAVTLFGIVWALVAVVLTITRWIKTVRSQSAIADTHTL